MDDNAVKCVVVGDGAVGKTCLLMVYASGNFVEDHVPTVFDNFSTFVRTRQSADMVKLSLFDTAGQEDYDSLRPLAYPYTSIFLICFSVVDIVTLENVALKWVKEVKHHCPGVPYLLVGTKVDLRQDPRTVERLAARRQVPISVSRGRAAATYLGAVGYFECSAKTGLGIGQIFDEALTVALRSRSRIQQKSCTVS